MSEPAPEPDFEEAYARKQRERNTRLIIENRHTMDEGLREANAGIHRANKAFNALWGGLFGASFGYHVGALSGRAATHPDRARFENRNRAIGGLIGMPLGGVAGAAAMASLTQKRKKKPSTKRKKKKRTKSRSRKRIR